LLSRSLSSLSLVSLLHSLSFALSLSHMSTHDRWWVLFLSHFHSLSLTLSHSLWCRVHKRPTMGSLAVAFPLSLSLALTFSLSLSRSRSLSLSCSRKSCVPKRPTMGDRQWGSLSLSLSFASLALLLSRSLALSLFFSLSLSIPRSLCLHNEDGIDSGFQLVLPKQATAATKA